jgi:hypothetical protein
LVLTVIQRVEATPVYSKTSGYCTAGHTTTTTTHTYTETKTV